MSMFNVDTEVYHYLHEYLAHRKSDENAVFALQTRAYIENSLY